MANSKSTSPIPPRGIIENRIEEQRRRVFHAQAICGIASLAARRAQGHGNHGDATTFTQNAWSALEAVEELLGRIAEGLEADVLLAQREHAGEQAPNALA
jgi:hypothetical protein